ncbi:MAG: pyridoxal phosphate-dependent aminotransferase [Deltaproteobacteria bacterium]|nr:pyridoxal phosphate-dependent aminotransferase [Deltaproteobacteria bacterium]
MSGLHLSQRGAQAPASPIRRLTPLADAARERGLVVHQLNIGQPDIATPAAMIEAYRRYDERVLAYSPSDGYRAYREKLADYYTAVSREGGGSSVAASDIVVTVGGSEALMFAIAAVCEPGDELLVCEPFYTNYAGFAHLLGVSVRAVTTRAAEGFRIDPERVAAAIGPRTRALCLPTPGNPTGVVLAREELEALAAICRERGLYFVCDEVYREFVYDGPEGSRAPSVLSLAEFDEHAVVIDSVSKRYSACGARIGALVTRNKALREAALRFGQARLSPATVDQHAAMAALDTPPEYFHEVVREYRARRDVLVAGLRRIGVECTTPEGAFYLVVPLPVDDADRFCRFLLEEFALDGETVMLAPASGFYATAGLGTNEVRMAYVLDVPRLEKSVRILGAALDAYRTRSAG